MKGVGIDEDRRYEGANDYKRESGLDREKIEGSREEKRLGGRM